MYFGQILKDIAIQYAFVKNPGLYIDHLYYQDSLENLDLSEYDEEDVYQQDGFPTPSEAQVEFKNTQIYQALKFDKKDSHEVAALKQKYTEAYIEILNAMGLAIQARIIKGIEDKFTVGKAEDVDDAVFDYLASWSYADDLNGIISSPEHPIDHLSFYIASRKLDEKGVEELKNLRDFYLETVDHIQDSLTDLKGIDFMSEKGFNYEKVKEWIIPFYAVPNEIAKGHGKVDISDVVDEDEDTINRSKLSDEEYKKMTDFGKKGKLAAGKNQRKIMSVEEALKKNFADLVGLKDVQSAILRKTKLIKKLPNKIVDCNFRLTGNPGVGKTTVAEAMSKTFYDAGIIKNPEFIQLNGAGLKGKYVGHTVPKVQEMFEKAKGGTLFLDEVYSLISEGGGDDGDSFAQEAITELMIQVEKLYNEQKTNPDAKTLIILAGYQDKVNILLDKNIGFKRRFPNAINIKDYTVEELEEIFKLYVDRDGFKVNDEAENKIKEILTKESKKKNFSNAGYVRNLVQAVEESQAARADEDDFVITLDDALDAEKNMAEDVKEKEPLGFH